MFRWVALFFALLCLPIAAMSARSASAAVPAPCAAATPGTAIVNPPALYAKGGKLDLTLTLVGQTISSGQAICWVYATQIGGKTVQLNVPPTLNVRQGDRLSITLINTLEPPSGNISTPPPLRITPATASAMPMAMSTANPYALMCGQPQLVPTPTPDPVTGRIYGYHRSPWNEANLHFHGLNTSPAAPSDDVVNVLLCPHSANGAPASYHYVVDIPADEPPGMYWYHPHAHGESLYQVFAGLTGAIVVHAVTPSVPDLLANRVIIVRDSPAHQGISKYARTAALVRAQPTFAQIRAQLAASDYKRGPGGDPFAPPDTCPGPQVPYNSTNLTVNGIPLPFNGNLTTNLPATAIGFGETQYWQLANTDAQTTLDLVMLVNGKATPLMVTARDGVPLITKNGLPTYTPVAMDHVFLPPASRIEFYLTGSVAGAQIVLRTNAIDTGCVGDTDLARNLLAVRVGTKKVAQDVIIPIPANEPPQRFSDLGAQKPTVFRTFVLTEYIRSDEGEPDFYITEVSNPAAVEHPYRMTGPADTVVKSGTVEQWTILNYTNEIHGFHIHQIHFMPTAGVTLEAGLGQLVDTVYVAHGGYDAAGVFQPRGVRLLMDFRDKNIIGTFVYHCHFLEHEDNGMMARIQVVP